MKKRILHSIAFFGILVILLFLSSQIVKPKDNTKEAGMRDVDANGILAEPENTIDALFIGDSESHRSIIPLQIFEETGITSYCCGTDGQQLPYTVEFLRKTFERQSPKVVLLEIDTVFRPFSVTDILHIDANRLLPVLQYHDRWKSLTLRDFDFSVSYTLKDADKGYQFTNYILPPDDTVQPKEDYLIDSKNRFVLEQIHKYCVKNHAEMVLISVPSKVNWTKQRHDSIQQAADEMHVRFIDMNENGEIDIDWLSDTCDKGDHMNYTGASKVSSYMAQFLQSCSLPDHRNDLSHVHWLKELEDFHFFLSQFQ